MADDKPLREPPRARAAFEAYCSLGPGRSLVKLLAVLKRRGQDDGTPSVTNRLATLEAWSKRFAWPARAAAFDAEQELIRREAFEREARRREAENARLLHQVGAGCLAIGSLILATYNDDTGRVKSADLTEASRIIKTGADILRAASGLPSDVVAIADLRAVRQRYESADPETRAAVVAGLRALRRLQRGEDGDEG